MNDQTKTFFGNAKEHQFPNGDIMIKCGIKVSELRALIANMSDDEWLNWDTKKSQSGKWYSEVNTWKPQGQQQRSGSNPNNDFMDDPSIPF